MDARTIKATHKSSVTAILGENTRPVQSVGRQFLNRDRWTGRILLDAMCRDIQANPRAPLTFGRVSCWVQEANAAYVPNPAIQIADTPDNLNDRVIGALIGGAYHEAWHTKYSCRRDLKVNEVLAIMTPRWAKVSNWSNAAALLLEWANIIEDIRIERLGCAEYLGTHTKMCDLQDFILDQEAKGNAAARAHGVAVNGALSVIGKTFRDLGLGYNTNAQRAALDSYKRDNAMAYRFATTGAVAKSLDEAIHLTAADDLGCLRIAFDVLIAIADASQAQSQPQQGQQGQQGDKSQQSKGDKQSKADKGDKQSKADKGDKQSKADKGDKQSKADKGDKGQQDKQGDDSDAGDKDDGQQGDGNGKGDKQDKQDKGDAGDAGDKGDDQQGQGDKSQGDAGEGDDSDSDDAEGDTDDAEGDTDDGDESGDGAGGHDNGDGKSLSDALKDALNKREGMGLKDNNTALSDAFQQIEQQQIKQEGGVQSGEAVYRPADKTLDRVFPVTKVRADNKRDDADKVLDSVKSEIAYLRARLRNVFRAAEMTATVHGTRTGRTLSDRMLVDSRVALMGGTMPSRAYQQRDEQMDMSLACAIVLDQSGSMYNKLVEATQAMMAIAEPMDAIGAKVQAVGFRDGQSLRVSNYEAFEGCHELNGVDLDIFKDYDERFAVVKSRFACTRATGGTPMANGIQFALNGLNDRKEGHRVLFVITDGQPDYNHTAVVKRQIRIAKEAGIHVIGVGIGCGAQYVTQLFPDYVYSPDLKGLPQQLVAKVNGIVDRAARKRGVRMKAA